MMHPVNIVPLRPRSRSRDGIQSRLEDLNLQPKPKVVSAVAASELEDGDTIFIEHHLEQGECTRRKDSLRSSKGSQQQVQQDSSTSCDASSVGRNDDGGGNLDEDDSGSTVSFWGKALRLLCANRIGFFIMFAAPVVLFLGVVCSPDQFAHLTWESFVTVELTIVAMMLMINDQPSDLVSCSDLS
jgi:hypothetical protein